MSQRPESVPPTNAAHRDPAWPAADVLGDADGFSIRCWHCREHDVVGALVPTAVNQFGVRRGERRYNKRAKFVVCKARPRFFCVNASLATPV